MTPDDPNSAFREMLDHTEQRLREQARAREAAEMQYAIAIVVCALFVVALLLALIVGARQAG